MTSSGERSKGLLPQTAGAERFEHRSPILKHSEYAQPTKHEPIKMRQQ